MEDVFEISQEAIGQVEQQVQLVNGHEVRVERIAPRKITKYRINSLVLADKGKWRVKFPWLWLFTALLCVAVLLPGSLVSFIPSIFVTHGSYVLGGIIVSLCLVMIWQKTTLVKAYYSMKSRCPLIELARNKPSKEEFTTFVRHLEENIRRYQEKKNIPEDMQLAGEMRTLRRLKMEGIIKNATYENAKEKLFKLF